MQVRKVRLRPPTEEEKGELFLKKKYCPVCKVMLDPVNGLFVIRGYEKNYIYIHQGVIHNESDIEAFNNGI